ncbi:alcohol dehydrogenase catalytic domain-containing protein [Erwinia sp.]|uniref:alcohol dehydrogenase catalytic domain-containing protein n=1 Tax=Erwinia citreus TaxID=558 RepID=UPI00289CC20F|nr:alcohol dehydrogenase catalytic domain-containing protein [Erwinia sp.]
MRLTASASCGTDLHFLGGALRKMKEVFPGHKGLRPIEAPGNEVCHYAVGDAVRNVAVGVRVVVCSPVSCGYFPSRRKGHTAWCNSTNWNGSAAGICFFGRPESTGRVNERQAGKARKPDTDNMLVNIPIMLPTHRR